MRKIFGRCRYCSEKVKLSPRTQTDPVALVDHAPGYPTQRRNVRDCDGSRSTMFDKVTDNA